MDRQKNKWSAEGDALVISYIELGMPFEDTLKHVNGRMAKSYEDRYYRYLLKDITNPFVYKNPRWTHQEASIIREGEERGYRGPK
jgi:hypothetical protein